MAKDAQEKQWETENAASTLKRAEEIKANKPLLKRAQTQLKKEQQAINKAVKPARTTKVTKTVKRKK